MPKDNATPPHPAETARSVAADPPEKPPEINQVGGSRPPWLRQFRKTRWHERNQPRIGALAHAASPHEPPVLSPFRVELQRHLKGGLLTSAA
jgi:hypothetical protein